jgi:siroheme synthase
VIDSSLSLLATASRNAGVKAPAVIVVGEAVGFRAKLLGLAASAALPSSATHGVFA